MSGFAIDINSLPGGEEDYLALKSLKIKLQGNVETAKASHNAAKAANPQDPGLPALQTAVDEALRQLATNVSAMKKYEANPSRSFIRDILSDGVQNGVAFHRLQVLSWTLAYWGIFILTLIHKITMRDFDATQLALMGISGATYLGFKLQESSQPTVDGSGAAATSPRSQPQK